MCYAGLWLEYKRNYVADKLFSLKTDTKGNPVGIGLSIWRFNVGAGSIEQGDKSMIKNVPRRTECFLLPDGTYDWTKQQGQQVFLKLAKERGVPHFVAFLNSPPVYFTKNGLATNYGREKNGGGYGRTMKTALYVARIIHHDLVYAKARSWQWWRALGGDYKDGLMRMYDEASPEKARVEDSKLLWVLGNYSRFIRPGAVRYELSSDCTDPTGLMVSAYKNKGGNWVVVAVNYAFSSRVLSLSHREEEKKWKIYRTSDTETLSYKGRTKLKNIQLPVRSVMTFVSECKGNLR